jgi:ankyrin repeat protein
LNALHPPHPHSKAPSTAPRLTPASPSLQNPFNRPPQASKGHAGIVRLLLAAGAKPDAKDATGATPLHRAAATGRLEGVRALVEEGRARVDARDKAGSTPLLVAVSCQQPGAALYLASKGADLAAANKAEETPLGLAGPLAAALQQAAGGGGDEMEM